MQTLNIIKMEMSLSRVEMLMGRLLSSRIWLHEKWSKRGLTQSFWAVKKNLSLIDEKQTGRSPRTCKEHCQYKCGKGVANISGAADILYNMGLFYFKTEKMQEYKLYTADWRMRPEIQSQDGAFQCNLN